MLELRALCVTVGLAVASIAAVASTAHAAPPDPARPSEPKLVVTAPTYPVERYTLANGLEVILGVDHRTPQVAVNLWYHVGSKDEPKGMQEFAHLFEHLFFAGSRNVGVYSHRWYLQQGGATDHNGTTSMDCTSYYEALPSHQLALALWLESDRMGFFAPALTEKNLAKERAVVRNERRERSETQPYGYIEHFAMGALYPPDHPYHMPPPRGVLADLDRATLKELNAFYRRFYVPANATMVVVGDFDVPRTKSLIAKYFAPLPRGSAQRTSRAAVPVSLAAEKRVEVEADVANAQLRMLWPTPPHLTPGDAELDVVARVLGHGRSSRLYRRLVHDLQLADDVSVLQASHLLVSEFRITVTLRPGASADKVRTIIDEELDRLRTTPVPLPDLERARVHLASELLFRSETLLDRADMFQEYAQRVGDPGYLGRDVARYTEMTPAHVQRSATTFLPRDKRVVVIVTPKAGAPRAGRLAGSAP